MTDARDALRPLNRPRPIAVATSARGLPQAVTDRGRMRRVVSVRDTWRIDDEWWHETPLSRRYFEIMLEGGRLVTIYRDLVTDEWYTQPYTLLPSGQGESAIREDGGHHASRA